MTRTLAEQPNNASSSYRACINQPGLGTDDDVFEPCKDMEMRFRNTA